MFTGRTKELNILEKAYASDAFQMVIMYGRRRVGKTSILQHFASQKPQVIFCTARETSAAENLGILSRSIMSQGPFPNESIDYESPAYATFEAALAPVFTKAADPQGAPRTLLIIDEYPYLAQSYPGISSLLQTLIDSAREQSNLMLVLCGSSMSFMEHQVLGHQSPLYGRRTAQIKVEPFDVFDAARLIGAQSFEETLPFYAIAGGVPLYLKQFDCARPLVDNVSSVLEQGSFLSIELENYLMQEVRTPAVYNAVIAALAAGETRISDIANIVKAPASAVSQYMKTLIELGIVERVTPMAFANKKQVIYRISDNLFRFWYRFVPRYAAALDLGLHDRVAHAIVENDFPTFMGPVFEQACRQWLAREIREGRIDILPTRIGSWWGADTQRKEQAEINVAAIGADGELILGECKWCTKPVDVDVLNLLAHRASLLPGGNKHLYLFSKSGFTQECKQAAKRANTTLIDAADMLN